MSAEVESERGELREESSEGDTAVGNLPPGVSGPPGILFRFIRDQRVLFLVVGGVNTVVGTLWFALFDSLIGEWWNGFGHYPALVITYVFAILCAFVLYRTIVFRVRGHVLRDLMRFSLVYVTAFVINIVLLAVLVTGMGQPALLSQCAIVLVTTVLSWFGHRKFSFRRPPPPAPAVETDPVAGTPTAVRATPQE